MYIEILNENFIILILDEKNDDFYRELKRKLFDKDQILSKTRSSSVIDNLVFPTNRSTSYWQKTTYSPYNAPSGSCSPNPCEHKGICTQKGQMTYECKCVGPWRGINCNVGM